MMCTNNSEYNLYFIISKSITGRDDIYGKFGSSKNINYEKRFTAYDTNNPSYLHVSVPYDKTIMHKLGTNHKYLDNYINNTVILKLKVHRSPNSNKTDWFFITKETAYNIMLFMVQFDESRNSHPIDTVENCIYFVRELRLLLQGDIEYATKCINDNSTNDNDYSPLRHGVSKYSPSVRESGEYTECPTQSLNTSTSIDTAQCYLETYFKRGGMCSMKKISKHPEWKPAYKNGIETKKIDICKSCEKRWLKGCCENYSRTNRTIWVMVVGWHEQVELSR